MIKRVFLIVFGSVFVVIGAIGIFLPLLPTTPFLLLSAACFVKSSDRMYNWLLNHKIFGVYISDYLKYKAITLKTKIIALTLIWLSMGYSILFVVSISWVRIILLSIATIVSLYILSIKTLRK